MATEEGHIKSPVDKGADIGNQEYSGVKDLFRNVLTNNIILKEVNIFFVH